MHCGNRQFSPLSSRGQARPRACFLSPSLLHICVFFALLIVVSVLDSTTSRADDLTLSEAPSYVWFHGCTPTSGMMVLGYWDAHGYSNLIDGSNSWEANRSSIKSAIASSGHIAQYALYGLESSLTPNANGRVIDNAGNPLSLAEDYNADPPFADVSSLDPDAAHADDSLADFMGTSRSALGLSHGVTRDDSGSGPNAHRGLEAYAQDKGCAFETEYDRSASWDDLAREIQFGRPVLLGVDSDFDQTFGRVDHAVAAVAFRIQGGDAEYGCYDTASRAIRWERFLPVSSEYGWGVGDMITLRPANTWDAAWKVRDGNWNDTWSWDNDLPHAFSVPDASTFTYIPVGDSAHVTSAAQGLMLNLGGVLDIQSAKLSLRSMRLCPGAGVFLDDQSAQLTVASTIANDGGIIFGQGKVAAAVQNDGIVHAINGMLEISGEISGSGKVLVEENAALNLPSGGRIGGNLSNKGHLFVDGHELEAASSVDGSGYFHLSGGATMNVTSASAAMSVQDVYLDSSRLVIPGPAGQIAAHNLYLDAGSEIQLSAQSLRVNTAYVYGGSTVTVANCPLELGTAGALYLYGGSTLRAPSVDAAPGDSLYLYASTLAASTGGVTAAQLFVSEGSHFSAAGDTTLERNLYVDHGSQFVVDQDEAAVTVRDAYATGNSMVRIKTKRFSANDLYLGDQSGGAEFHFTGSEFAIHDAHLSASSLIVDGPNIAIQIGGTIHADLHSTLRLAAAEVAFSEPYVNGGIVTVTTGVTKFNGGFTQDDGELNLAGGAIESASAVELNGGMLTGSGTITGDVHNHSVVSPGHSPGTIIIMGDYAQDGVLRIELAGTSPGEFDLLQVSGSATLGGTLEVSFIDGFLPAPGDRFDVLQASALPGAFDDLVLLDDRGIALESQYWSNGVTLLVVVPEVTPGCSCICFVLLLLATRSRRCPSWPMGCYSSIRESLSMHERCEQDRRLRDPDAD
jgi:hypothetical protein